MSRTTLLVSCIVCLGLGLIGGFAGFFFQYETACVDRLQQSDHIHELSLRQWQDKHAKLAASSTASKEDLSTNMQALLVQHQGLLEKHQEALDKVSSLEREAEQSSLTIRSLKDQLEQVRGEATASKEQLQQAIQKADQDRVSFETQLQKAQSTVYEKVQEVEELKANPDCAAVREQYEQEKSLLLVDLRRLTAQEQSEEL